MPDITHPSDSTEQNDAEDIILSKLSMSLRVALRKGRVEVRPSVYLELDAWNKDAGILCEVYAHCGKTKGGQIGKVRGDMMKLDHAETCLRVAGDKRVWRKLMVFQCKEAAQHFMPSSNAWDADWAMTNGIEIMVVDAGEETRERVKAAQARQYR